jgi:ankyrin repeat protein
VYGDGKTPVMMAIAAIQQEAAMELIEAASDIGRVSDGGRTALILAYFQPCLLESMTRLSS